MKPDVTQRNQRETVRAWLGSGSINVFGIQFSGKDTQCHRLAAWLDGRVLGGGDILRNRAGISDRVRQIMERGEYIPVEDYLAIVTPFFAREEFKGRPLLFSAVGRRIGEEQGALQSAKAAGHPILAAVELELPEVEVWKRWRLMRELKDREERPDDSEEGLRGRLEKFRIQTLPVIEFYRQQGLLLIVDGSKSPDEVEADILKGLYDLATRSE